MNELDGHLLGLAARRAVADGDVLHAVLFDELRELRDGFILLPFAVGGVDHRGVEHLAGRVNDRDLAAVGIAGVEAHRHMALDRRLHQKRLEVESEHFDRALTGLVRQRRAHLALKRGVDQAVVSVLGGGLNELHRGGAWLHDRAAQQRQRQLAVKQDGRAEHFLLLAAVDGEDLVPLETAERLLEIVVQAVDAVLLRRGEGAEPPALFQQLAQRPADGGIIADPLGDNIVCALQGVGKRLHALFRVDIGCRRILRSGAIALLREEQRRERLKPLFLGDGRAGTALGLVGTVKVLDLGERLRRVDGGGKLVGQLLLLGDARLNALLAFGEIAQIGKTLLKCAQGGVVHRAVQLLAVAGDERNGVALVEQSDDIFNVLGGAVQLACELFDNGHGYWLLVDSVLE